MVNGALNLLVFEAILEVNWDATYDVVSVVEKGSYLYDGYDTWCVCWLPAGS